jgi:hypothetical protein
MLVSQKGRCAICFSESAGGRCGKFAVDHCHKTGRVRGLLCAICNYVLGLLRDDPAAFRRAAAYLEFTNTKDNVVPACLHCNCSKKDKDRPVTLPA